MSATKLQGASLFLLICRQLQDSVVTGREDPSGRRTNASTFSLQRLIGGSPETQPVGCGPPARAGATLAPGPGLPCQRRSLKAARITWLKISGCCLRIRYQSGPATG